MSASTEKNAMLSFKVGDVVFYVPTLNVEQTLVTGIITDIIDPKKERYEVTLITSRKVVMAEAIQLVPQIH